MGGFSFADFKKPGVPISSKVIGEVLPRDYRLVLTKLYPKAILNERTDIAALGDIVHELRQVAGIIGARVLRDVNNDVLLEHAEKIRDDLGDRALLRAFCYMGEIIRTLEASSYIITDDIERFITLLNLQVTQDLNTFNLMGLQVRRHSKSLRLQYP